MWPCRRRRPAGRLPSVAVSLDVKQIVGDLERLADCGALACQRLRSASRLREDAPASVKRRIAGLHRLQRRHRRLRRAPALAVAEGPSREVSICPPTMPPNPRGATAPAPARCAPPIGWMSGRARMSNEGQEAVAGEDRGRLVERLARSLTASQVVVHRRQIVAPANSNARIRARCRPSARSRGIIEQRTRDHQERLHALAAAEADSASTEQRCGRARRP